MTSTTKTEYRMYRFHSVGNVDNRTVPSPGHAAAAFKAGWDVGAMTAGLEELFEGQWYEWTDPETGKGFEETFSL